MKRIEFYDKRRSNEAVPILRKMSEVYPSEFAKAPWFEASRCDSTECSQNYSQQCIGDACMECGNELVEAYNPTELFDTWMTIVREEDGLVATTIIDENPSCVTVVRPTNPTELYMRKYQTVEPMRQWLSTSLEDGFIWVEDTFADRSKFENGNMKNRGQVLGGIALRYGNLAIATRTLVEPVIASTLRDVAEKTDVFIGNSGAGKKLVNNARSVGAVPDARTLLVIGDKL